MQLTNREMLTKKARQNVPFLFSILTRRILFVAIDLFTSLVTFLRLD
ncbi:hypothetical protein HNQ72_000380 [Rhizobium wenxiniae]|uniref:Uncharacterized protein n=1 Tax=Rhizobium wenxiniae TaxID=1737357 RepID=A0A7W9Y310_9HYPH|nr:hypothetical protein [Rhizobium wenxiniae]